MRKNFRFILRITAAAALMIIQASAGFCAFRDNGWGVRSAGMGGMFTAVSDDASAVSWNPAGIVQMDRIEVILMREELYAGLEGVNLGAGYAAFAVPMNERLSVGGGWSNMTSRDQYRENVFMVSAGYRAIEQLYAGISLKAMEHSYVLDEYNLNNPVFDDGRGKTVFTADAGIMYLKNSGKSDIKAGLSVRNITEPDAGLDRIDPVPREVRLGAVYVMKDLNVMDKITLNSLSPGLEVSWRDDDLNVHAGAETWLFSEKMGVRGGGNLREITLGGSYIYSKSGTVEVEIDYSFRLPLKIEGSFGSHRFGLTFTFDNILKN